MRKCLETLAMMAAVTLPLSAMADGVDYPGTFFVNGGLGQSQYRVGGFDDPRDTAAIIGFGYRWNHVFGIEAGYTDLGTGHGHSASGVQSLEVKGWTLGMNGRFVIAGPWSLAARAVVFRARTAALARSERPLS